MTRDLGSVAATSFVPAESAPERARAHLEERFRPKTPEGPAPAAQAREAVEELRAFDVEVGSAMADLGPAAPDSVLWGQAAREQV